MKFLWTTLYVKDLESSIDFYKKYAELNVTRQFKLGDLSLAFLGQGETQLELIEDPSRDILHSKDLSIGFEVKDIENHFEKLQGDDVKINQEIIETPTSKFFMVTDLNGVNVQFIEIV